MLFVSHLVIDGLLSRFQFLIVRNLITTFGIHLCVVAYHLVIFQEDSSLGTWVVHCGLKHPPVIRLNSGLLCKNAFLLARELW